MILKTELFDHQKKAVKKLSGLRVGALFMEMGTGKTRTILELANQKKAKWDRILYFCPCSVKETIANEIKKHTEGMDYVLVDSKKIVTASIMIIGIESLSNSDRLYLELRELVTDKTFVIVDESILIKNHHARRTRRIIDIAKGARYRFIMCGTPMSQGMVDLYAQFFFLSPQIMGYEYFLAFVRRHIQYSEKYPGKILKYYNAGWVAAKINPYIYQVTKEECLDLPAKQFYTEYFTVTGEMKRAYEQVKRHLLMEIDYEEFQSYTIFKLFTALQQVVSSITPKGFDIVFSTNPRLDLLQDVLDRVVYPVVIFCKFRHDIDMIGAKIKNFSQHHGGLNRIERSKSVDDFQSGRTDIFLCSQQSGSYGLNLQMAQTVIFYNNQFSYEKRRQAIDRAHRIGMNPGGVNYIDLCCTERIDSIIMACLERKTSVIHWFKEEIEKVKDKQEKKKRIKELC